MGFGLGLRFEFVGFVVLVWSWCCATFAGFVVHAWRLAVVHCRVLVLQFWFWCWLVGLVSSTLSAVWVLCFCGLCGVGII